MYPKYFILSLFVTGCFCDAENPLVQTPLGKVQGFIKTSHDGRKFSAFEGIPFAKPAIGQRRFEKPEPVEPWHGVWHANHPTICPQYNFFQLDLIIGDEDCLHLNVYVPRETPNPEENLEVFVSIHGGAYMIGSGHMFTPPDGPMDRDIILVTFNYRLGILGFLSTEDDALPGNNGMKDQVMALKWVQENIKSFGGNPNSVTLGGVSAGASSVHLHYFSDMSKGLFHRGISTSGVALNPFSIQEGALAKAKILAGALGCPTSTSKVLVECLKQKPAKSILEKGRLLYIYKMIPIAPFAPVVEKGPEPFLKADPYQLLAKGEVLDLPWLVSNTAHEGHIEMILQPDDIEYYRQNWESIAPELLDFNYTVDKSSRASTTKKIKNFYFGNEEISAQNVDKLIQVVGDRLFLVGAETSVKMQSKVTKSPVYYYYFTYLGDNNEATYASHGADAKYYFGASFDGKPLTENEKNLKNIFLDMLVSYAKTGSPVIKGIEWKASEGDEFTYLNISSHRSEEFTLKTVEEFTPRSFWNSLGFAENENLLNAKDEL